MLRALYNAASGMQAIQLNIDNISNNLANVNTTGFKQRRTQFQDLMYQSLITPGSSATTQTEIPTGLQIGLGTRAVSNEIIFLQGDYVGTGNPLDLAIEGQGFFKVRLADGTTGYTRAGAFHLSRDGAIVTSGGDPVDPQIVIPTEATDVSIGQDGTVSVLLPGEAQAQIVGQFQLSNFANPAGLNSIGRNLYLPTAASGDPVDGLPTENGNGGLLQRFLEQSNVNIVEEMVNLIVSQRTYESNARVLRTADQMFQELNNLNR
ncbi:MAG: flagellar basal-body rod protein FlgG [Acidobacteriota bacterium]